MSYGSQFVAVRPRPAATSRLFCFPHAGGGPAAFFKWTQHLEEGIECVCLQYPGRGQRLREEPLTSVREIVDEIHEGFAEFFDKPFAFYGHSFGGVVAFELARQLRRAGLPGPSHLFVGAVRPPHLKGPHAPLHTLPEPEFVAGVQARYGGIPVEIAGDPEVLQMFMPAIRADFTAYETYRCEADAPLAVPILIFAGADDRAVQLESLQEWGLHTEAGFDLKVLPGDHFFPATSASELIAMLQKRIGRPQGWVGRPQDQTGRPQGQTDAPQGQADAP